MKIRKTEYTMVHSEWLSPICRGLCRVVMPKSKLYIHPQMKPEWELGMWDVDRICHLSCLMLSSGRSNPPGLPWCCRIHKSRTYGTASGTAMYPSYHSHCTGYPREQKLITFQLMKIIIQRVWDMSGQESLFTWQRSLYSSGSSSEASSASSMPK